jgi:dihydrofolate reductase
VVPRASVFVGTSVDGYIARLNHELDFLPPGGGEPHGYEEFIKSVNALVIGRNTYDKVLSFDPWPYGNKPVIVLTGRAFTPPSSPEAVVEQMSGSPAEVLSRLAARGWTHVYVDGGITITQFLAAGLVQRLIITRVPVLIGTGIPLFGKLPHDVRLEHVATGHYQSGLVQSEYVVLGKNTDVDPGY